MAQKNPDTDAPTTEVDPSIIDAILDLDAFLSGDVRRAEDLAWFCTKPHLEADLALLDAELASLVDANGRALAAADDSLGSKSRGAAVVAAEREQVAREMQASMRSIRLRQLPSDEWDAFETKHKALLRDPNSERIPMFDELVTLCAIAPTFTAKQLAAFRKVAGPTAVAAIHQKAWDVNNKAGVSVPKSSTSSAVLRLAERAKS